MKPEVPPNIQPYVDVLTAKKAVAFLLEFGGAPIHLTPRPHARSRVVALVGMELAKKLGERFGAGYQRVPTNRRWMARQMRADEIGIHEIARRLHVSAQMVRNYLKDGKPPQLDLFDQN